MGTNLTDVLSQVPVAGDSLSSMLGGNNLNAYVTSGSEEDFIPQNKQS